MKIRFIIFFFCVGLCHQAIAQIEIKEWAPLGATWLYWQRTYYSHYKLVKVEHKKDTVLFRHVYKKFDIYYLEYYAPSDNRYSKYITSYYIGIKGDTIFQPSFGREIFHVDKNIIGDTVYPFRACDPNDTIWYRLDTLYDYLLGGVKFKVKVYSGNNSPRFNKKDTLYSFFPGKHPIGYGNYHFEPPQYSGILYKGSLKCYQNSILLDTPYPISAYMDVLGCYYDSIVGHYGYGFICPIIEKFSSIREYSASEKIEISPNPTENILRIRGLDNRRKPLMGIVYNSEGKYIFSIPISGDEMDVSRLDKGPYYLSIQDQQEVIANRKFIKH